MIGKIAARCIAAAYVPIHRADIVWKKRSQVRRARVGRVARIVRVEPASTRCAKKAWGDAGRPQNELMSLVQFLEQRAIAVLQSVSAQIKKLAMRARCVASLRMVVSMIA